MRDGLPIAATDGPSYKILLKGQVEEGDIRPVKHRNKRAMFAQRMKQTFAPICPGQSAKRMRTVQCCHVARFAPKKINPRSKRQRLAGEHMIGQFLKKPELRFDEFGVGLF